MEDFKNLMSSNSQSSAESKNSKKTDKSIREYLANNRLTPLEHYRDFRKQLQSFVILSLDLKGMSDEHYQLLEEHIVNRFVAFGGSKDELVRDMRKRRDACNLSVSGD